MSYLAPRPHPLFRNFDPFLISVPNGPNLSENKIIMNRLFNTLHDTVTAYCECTNVFDIARSERHSTIRSSRDKTRLHCSKKYSFKAHLARNVALQLADTVGKQTLTRLTVDKIEFVRAGAYNGVTYTTMPGICSTMG